MNAEVSTSKKKPITHQKQVDAAKPQAKSFTLTIGEGLHLRVDPSGAKYFIYRYTFNNKRFAKSLGAYPALPLSEAKRICFEFNQQIALGIDPYEQKKNQEVEAKNNSAQVKKFANLWVDNREIEGKDTKEDHRHLKVNILPKIGDMTVVSMDTAILDDLVISPIIKRGAIESARRVRGMLCGIFEIPRRLKIIKENPANDLLVPTPQRGNHAALTEPATVAPMLKAMWSYCERGTRTVFNALILSIHIFIRPNELRKLKWDNVNFEDGYIEYVHSKQRNKKNLKTTIIPMSHQVKQILEYQRMVAGDSPYVFPAQHYGTKEPFISSGTIRNALINIGYEGLQTPHGFRATAATILHERLKQPMEYIEMQLAHKVKAPNGTAYHRGKWLEDRRDMMQKWSDCIDDLREKGEDALPKLIGS